MSKIKEIVVGTGKQLKFGNFKAHASMTLTIPDEMTIDEIRKVAAEAFAQCDCLVRESLQEQADAEAGILPGKQRDLLADDEVN